MSLGQIDALVFFEFLGDPVDQSLVYIIAAQMGVAIGRFDFHDIFADFQNGNIKSPAAKIIDGDQLIFLLVHAISQSCRRGFVDNALDFQTGNFAGVLGSLALGVIEIGRNRDYRFGDFFTKIILSRFLEFLQD